MRTIFAVAVLLVSASVFGQSINGANVLPGTLPPSALKQQAANTLVGNCTAGTALPATCTAAQAKSSLAISNSDVSGLGTMATQNASAVTITGGAITGITDLAVADGGTGASTAAGARTGLGLGTVSTQNASGIAITGGSITGITDLAIADGGTGASTAGAALTNFGGTTVGQNLFTLTNPSAITFLRANADNTITARSAANFRTDLSLVAGTDIQAYNANLAAIAGITTAADKVIYWTGSGTAASTDLSSFARTLIDDTTAAVAATTLGLGTGSSPTFTGLTTTGVHLLADGTVSLPGLAFASDPDTGCYRIGANNFGCATGGVIGLQQDSSQNVGVGLAAAATLSAKLHVLSTTEQLRLGYDASNYTSFTVSSSGATTWGQTGGNSTISSTLIAPGGVYTAANAANANFTVPSGSSSTSTTTSQFLFAGAGTIAYRAAMRGNTNPTLGVSNSYASFLLAQETVTEAASGTQALLAQEVIRPLAVTAGVATVTNGATLYIEDAGNAVTTGGNYALWVDAGGTRLDGDATLGAHVISTGTAPTLSSCGSSPTISGTDLAGTVTAGATSTGCTVTFAAAYASAPHCTVTPQTGSIANAFSYAVSASAITVTQTALGTGLFDYHCVQ